MLFAHVKLKLMLTEILLCDANFYHAGIWRIARRCCILPSSPASCGGAADEEDVHHHYSCRGDVYCVLPGSTAVSMLDNSFVVYDRSYGSVVSLLHMELVVNCCHCVLFIWSCCSFVLDG